MNRIKSIVYFGFNNPLKYKRGAENVILFQSQALNNSISKFYIFFGEKDEEFKWGDIECISIKHNIFRFVKLNKIIKDKSKKYDVIIHSHNYLMSFFLYRKTDIFTVLDGLYYQSVEINHNLKKVFKFIEKKVYDKSELIHFISQFTKEKSLYNSAKTNFEIIYITTPLEKVKFQNDKVWNSHKLKIFTVRSVEDRANLDLLIDLARKNMNYEIKIAGKGPLLEKYREIICREKIDNIEFLGFLSDQEIRTYYSNSDMVIVTAKYGEGFGLPIIEGYLHNKPVLASNVCAIPEIIFKKEFLFENNVLDIESKIKNYFIKSDQENCNNFKKYYDDHFSYNKIIKEYKNMYFVFGL